MQTKISFEQIPVVLFALLQKVEDLEVLLKASQNPTKTPERLNAQLAADYLNLALPTLYGLVSNKKLKHYKTGKKLSFLTSDLDAYLNSGVKPTIKELAAKNRRSK